MTSLPDKSGVNGSNGRKEGERETETKRETDNELLGGRMEGHEQNRNLWHRREKVSVRPGKWQRPPTRRRSSNYTSLEVAT